MTFSIFEQYKQLDYGLSEKTDGNLKIGAGDLFFGDYIKSQKLQGYKIFRAGIIHSNKVEVVGKEEQEKIIAGCDGLVTNIKDNLLTVTVADCFPVYFYDPGENTVGIVHAGWKGIISNIIPHAIRSMKKSFNSNPSNLLVGVGPGIQKHHFEIKKDVLSKFENYSNFIKLSNNLYFVDLPGIINLQLLDFGVNSANIEVSQVCTDCEENKYFSHRREKTANVQAMLAYIGIR